MDWRLMIEVENSFLYSIREQSSFTWKKMICELIDNAFDAEASTVDLRWPGGQVFSIEDDGIGTEDVTRLLRLGKRHEHERNSVGKYGVGSKYAMIWLWGQSYIESRCGGHSFCAEVDWEEIANDIGTIPKTGKPCERTRPGTLIRCQSNRQYPRHNSLAEDIGATYTPGIELGKRIRFHLGKRAPMVIVGREWPIVEREECVAIVAAGREVQVRIAIVAEGCANPYSGGISFERDYRVIKESRLGVPGDVSTDRLACRVTLGKEWKLSTNKDDFDEYHEELGEAIESNFGDLMEKASHQAMTFEDTAFNNELAALIVAGAREKKREARPGEPTQTGSVEPKESGRKREHAAFVSDNDGSVVGEQINSGGKNRKSGFSVSTYTATDGRFGKYDNDGRCVLLNLGNAWLAEKHRERNQDALLPVVYGIISDHAIRNHDERFPLLKNQGDFSDFSHQWGELVWAAARSRGLVGAK